MYKLIIVLFFITSCSIYDLSGTSGLSNLFDKESGIIIQSPNINIPLVMDNLPLLILINDTNGIDNINITSPHGTITVNTLNFPSSFKVFRTIPITNQGTGAGDYNTSHGKYPLEISYKNRYSQTITSNYTLNIKIASVYYNTITYPSDRPPTSTGWRANDEIKITVSDKGARITRIEIAGTLGARAFDWPSPPTGLIVIPLKLVSSTVPVGQIDVLVRIISENNGVSTEGFELRY